MVLYARKDAAEQLRSVRGISLEILSRETIEGVYVVTAKATTKEGRFDASTGAVAIESLKGEARANAMMKAETKAKRRVTLSICGLGLMDETEVETIEGARTVSVEQAHTLIEAPSRKVPEELMVVVDKLRKGDFSAVKSACAFLEACCAEEGILPAYTNRQTGLRTSFPRGKVIPAEVMESFLLDVWSEIEEARLRRAAGEIATEAPKAEPAKEGEYVATADDLPF